MWGWQELLSTFCCLFSYVESRFFVLVEVYLCKLQVKHCFLVFIIMMLGLHLMTGHLANDA